MMTMENKMKIIIYGIQVKLKRGESLKDILKSYKKLTAEEKEFIRSKLAGGEANEG